MQMPGYVGIQGLFGHGALFGGTQGKPEGEGLVHPEQTPAQNHVYAIVLMLVEVAMKYLEAGVRRGQVCQVLQHKGRFQVGVGQLRQGGHGRLERQRIMVIRDMPILVGIQNITFDVSLICRNISAGKKYLFSRFQ